MIVGRRDFFALVGGAVACSANAWAQQRGHPVIGVLSSGSADAYAPIMAVFREALAGAGYIEHKNVTMDYHWRAVNWISCQLWRLIWCADT